ncbi:hypothetical protein [Isoptericola rhizosphaerae]|uniref:hypothetical protein n=1 Tax=Isoptericola rhizosphaerae TaxID=3377837 RepID=UPI00383AD13E
MALKAATTVVPADGVYTYTAVQVEAKLDGLGPAAQQKQSKEGVPQWTIDVLRVGGDAATDLMSVTVPSPARPEVLGPVTFKGLRAGLWLGEKPRQGGIYWQADAVVPAKGTPPREG